MDRREYHRAQLRLPVRLRWTTPLGQKTEVRDTLDISRGGLLVTSAEAHDLGVPLWVTFPYDNSVGDRQPEILARVVRAAHTRNGGSSHDSKSSSRQIWQERNLVFHEAALGLHFENNARSQANGNRQEREHERRASSRLPVSLPIRVRPEHIRWFEETMTVDVSDGGIRFLSSREYLIGENLMIAFESSVPARWTGPTEFHSRVLRLELTCSTTLAVSVSRVPGRWTRARHVGPGQDSIALNR